MPLEVSDAVLWPPLMKQTKIYFEQNFQMAGKGYGRKFCSFSFGLSKSGRGCVTCSQFD